MKCNGCGADDEVRLGFCFDCANAGEVRAAKMSVLQHLSKAITNARRGAWWNAKIDVKWAYERLTRTGDYRRDGYFDKMGIDWRGK